MKKIEEKPRSQYLNVIQGNDGPYVIKSGKLIKIVEIVYPFGRPNRFNTNCDLKRYILEDKEVIDTYE